MLERFFDWYIALQSTEGYWTFVYIYDKLLACYFIFTIRWFYLYEKSVSARLLLVFAIFGGICLGNLIVYIGDYYVDNYYLPLKDMKSNFSDLNTPDLTPDEVEDPMSEEEKLKQEKRVILLKAFIIFTIWFGLCGCFSNIQ